MLLKNLKFVVWKKIFVIITLWEEEGGGYVMQRNNRERLICRIEVELCGPDNHYYFGKKLWQELYFMRILSIPI